MNNFSTIFVKTAVLVTGLILTNPSSLKAVKIDTSAQEAELRKDLETLINDLRTLDDAEFEMNSYWEKIECKSKCKLSPEHLEIYRHEFENMCQYKCKIEYLMRFAKFWQDRINNMERNIQVSEDAERAKEAQRKMDLEEFKNSIEIKHAS